MIKIIIEGKQGSGKTTTARLILEKLRESGVQASEVTYQEGNEYYGKSIISKFPAYFIITKQKSPCMCGLYQGCKLCGAYQDVKIKKSKKGK